MSNAMATKKETPVNERLAKLRDKSGLTQTQFAKKYFKSSLRGYQRWESTEDHGELPGPVQAIIEALERGGQLPE